MAIIHCPALARRHLVAWCLRVLLCNDWFYSYFGGVGCVLRLYEQVVVNIEKSPQKSMRIRFVIVVLFCSTAFACGENEDDRFIFFLHNRFLEEHELDESHPEFGRTEYKEILAEFEKSGLKVISEKRNGNVNARDYAVGIVNQIDSLTENGIEPSKITIVGTSKGGYIAQYVSTLANNPELNFVFVASFRNNDLENIPEINFCGNILTIYEKTDPFGVSAIRRKENSTCEIKNFKEIELNTGMGHGFLFKPLEEWIGPTIKWANGDYGLE